MRLQGKGGAAHGAVVPGLTELASGIDALYLSGHGEVRLGLADELEAHRDMAETHRESVPSAASSSSCTTPTRSAQTCTPRRS